MINNAVNAFFSYGSNLKFKGQWVNALSIFNSDHTISASKTVLAEHFD